jgi:sensor histidine kinase YesM
MTSSYPVPLFGNSIKRALFAAVWVTWAFLFAIQNFLFLQSREVPAHFGELFGRELLSAGVYALLFLAVRRLTRRYSFESRAWPAVLGVHLAGCALFVLVNVVAYYAIDVAVAKFTGASVADSISFSLYQLLVVNLSLNVALYLVFVGASYAFDFYKKFQERALRAAQLETQLAQTQLQALKMQLQPHFLFNTPHTISALVYENPRAADDAISRLSELLRATLAQAGAMQVPLAQEIEFLQHYIAIMQIRFERRLQVQVEVEPQAYDALVPNLILQPLVENAIRYAMKAPAATGQVGVRCERENGFLAVQIKDNGPGFQESLDVCLKNGFGLSNVAKRLAQLYGNEHALALQNAPEGGALVTLRLPWQTGNK